MSGYSSFSSQPVLGSILFGYYDPPFDVVRDFLNSDGVQQTLQNTFGGTCFQYEDLDGLSWSKGSTLFKTETNPSPLSDVQSHVESELPPLESASSPSLSICFPPGIDQPGYLPPRRMLSRSPRVDQINFASPQAGGDDPFAFVPVPFREEEDLDMEQGEKFWESMRPPSFMEGIKARLPAFHLVELPAEDDERDNDADYYDTSTATIDPPPAPPS